VETTSEMGASAEDRAAAALIAAGYVIVARNWSCDTGELDVVARDRDVLVFVEVRSRVDAAHGSAAQMVSLGKQKKVTRVAGMYLMLERPRFREARFDVVAVTGDTVEIIRDAWRL
jgi:putative endonuclease